MTTLQKVALAVVGVAMVTTLVYPTHNTSQVLGAATNLTTGTLKTAEGI
jgi:hypothetical protein